MEREGQFSSLSGRRVLLIEDEYFLADDLAKAVTALGADVVGPVADVEEALRMCSKEAPPDIAVLDINLKKRMIFPVAHELRSRGIPFIFISGYDREIVPDEFRDIVLLRKPIDNSAVAAALSHLIWTSKGSLPNPSGGGLHSRP